MRFNKSHSLKVRRNFHMAPKETNTLEPEKDPHQWLLHFYHGDPRNGWPIEDWYYECVSRKESHQDAFVECMISRSSPRGIHKVLLGDVIRAYRKTTGEEYYWVLR